MAVLLDADEPNTLRAALSEALSGTGGAAPERGRHAPCPCPCGSERRYKGCCGG